MTDEQPKPARGQFWEKRDPTSGKVKQLRVTGVQEGGRFPDISVNFLDLATGLHDSWAARSMTAENGWRLLSSPKELYELRLGEGPVMVSLTVDLRSYTALLVEIERAQKHETQLQAEMTKMVLERQGMLDRIGVGAQGGEFCSQCGHRKSTHGSKDDSDGCGDGCRGAIPSDFSGHRRCPCRAVFALQEKTGCSRPTPLGVHAPPGSTFYAPSLAEAVAEIEAALGVFDKCEEPRAAEAFDFVARVRRILKPEGSGS